MAHRTIAIDVPLDLRATLRPVTTVWGRWRADGWWRSLRTPGGPATMHLTRDDVGVRAVAWGEGADWCLDHLHQWIGLGDDPASFVTDHPVVGELHRRRQGARFARTGLVFEALLCAIGSQKVTGKEAASGLRALGRFSEPAPGPAEGLRLPPDPDRLAETPYYDFHGLGIEKRRADTIRRVAREARRIDRLADAETTDARAYLERLPGVGVWSSAETVAVSHGDADAVSVGDFHLKHVASWHLAGEARGTDERMLELLEPFRPHRGRVLRLLEGAGDYPRYGPRVAVRSFADY